MKNVCRRSDSNARRPSSQGPKPCPFDRSGTPACPLAIQYIIIKSFRNIRIKNTSEIVIPGMYLKILVLSKSFSNYDKNILVIGFLQDIATQKEIDKYIENNDNIDINETNDLV